MCDEKGQLTRRGGCIPGEEQPGTGIHCNPLYSAAKMKEIRREQALARVTKMLSAHLASSSGAREAFNLQKSKHLGTLSKWPMLPSAGLETRSLVKDKAKCAVLLFCT